LPQTPPLPQSTSELKLAQYPQISQTRQRYGQLLDQALENINLKIPEGFFGELVGGYDYRIRVKADRMQELDRLMNGFIGFLDTAEKGEQKIRELNRQCYEQYIDRVRAAHTLLKEQQRLLNLPAESRRQQDIEDAKAEAKIARYKKEARDALREPLAPPPPAPVVDECQRRRQAAQKERKFEYDLKIDAVEAEEDYQEKLTGNATARILKVFADATSHRAQKRMRIRNLVDTYGIVEELLPAGIVELLQEES
jgi:hypothetical protein